MRAGRTQPLSCCGGLPNICQIFHQWRLSEGNTQQISKQQATKLTTYSRQHVGLQHEASQHFIGSLPTNSPAGTAAPSCSAVGLIALPVLGRCCWVDWAACCCLALLPQKQILQDLTAQRQRAGVCMMKQPLLKTSCHTTPLLHLVRCLLERLCRWQHGADAARQETCMWLCLQQVDGSKQLAVHRAAAAELAIGICLACTAYVADKKQNSGSRLIRQVACGIQTSRQRPAAAAAATAN